MAKIRDDVKTAGASYVDEPVVGDGDLITSRVPADPPYFMREFIKALRASEVSWARPSGGFPYA